MTLYSLNLSYTSILDVSVDSSEPTLLINVMITAIVCVGHYI